MTRLTPISGDSERIRRVQQALAQSGFEALICSLPKHVLLLTGYWPVIGASIAVVAKGGATFLIVPKDEETLARKGHADEVLTFQPGSLDKLTDAVEEIRGPLAQVFDKLDISGGAIGSDTGSHVEPASYAATHFYGWSLGHLLREFAPDAQLRDAGELLADLRASLTSVELERERLACGLAGEAFEAGVKQLRAGLREMQVAALFLASLNTLSTRHEDVGRAGGFFFCMSGANSALAFAAYARSRERVVQSGDLVLMHCNTYIDGFWTDITRTYSIGHPDGRQQQMHGAVLEAREAALAVVRPGVAASEVDRAARDVLARRGFGKEFKHQLGHSVGFDAISHTAKPRLHPKSPDVLQAGMVFNVEPAIYIEGYGGIRHCDVVAVTDHGVEVLTPFHVSMEERILPEPRLNVA